MVPASPTPAPRPGRIAGAVADFLRFAAAMAAIALARQRGSGGAAGVEVAPVPAAGS
jgi:hypothetical protein